MTERTILIADDDRAIRTVLAQALGRAGYNVRATSSAATLWRWVEDGEGDLVITDVVMPDENGLDLVPRIRRVRPELRVVVMSAQSTFATALKAAQRGAFDYLPKPFDLKDLISLVQRALAAPAAAAEEEGEGPEEERLLDRVLRGLEAEHLPRPGSDALIGQRDHLGADVEELTDHDIAAHLGPQALRGHRGAEPVLGGFEELFAQRQADVADDDRCGHPERLRIAFVAELRMEGLELPVQGR